MTPDEINRKNGVVYRCRVCRAESGLHWFHGSSCPVCAKPECEAFCAAEWDAAIEAQAQEPGLFQPPAASPASKEDGKC